MSVIFGIRENEQIIIGGDRRGVNQLGEFVSDDLQKVTPINNNLCFAVAGNNGVGKAISMSIDNSGISDKMNVDELIDIINEFYNKAPNSSINNLPFSCLIAGCNSKNEPCLMSGVKNKSTFSIQSVPMILHHPSDTNLIDCNIILAKNYKFYHSFFVEQTIKDISKISKYVSPTGHKWIYNIKTGTSKLYSF